MRSSNLDEKRIMEHIGKRIKFRRTILGISQDGISKLEKRSDLLLSTLRKTVEAMGGSLSLVAEFPDRSPVVLSGIAEEELAPKASGRKRSHA